MNKAELIDAVAKQVRVSKTHSAQVLDAALAIIKSAVGEGQEVKLVGFGTFTSAVRKSRLARNPKTGIEVMVPAGSVPRFRPGKEFREQMKSV